MEQQKFQGLLDVRIHAFQVIGVGEIRLGHPGKGVGVQGGVEFIGVDGHGLGQVQRSKVGGGNGGGILAEIQVFVGQPAGLGAEHEGDARLGCQRRNQIGRAHV